MAQEQSGQQSLLDLPEEVQQSYDAAVDAAIDQMQPGMSDERRATTRRLYATLQRVFTELDYTPPEGGTLVELGMGAAPSLPAVQAAFHPAEHVGIDNDAGSLDAFNKGYPDLSAAAQSGIRAIVADATDPSAIPGFETGRQVDAVVALHPDISAYGKGDEAADALMDTFQADPQILAQLHNWRQRLTPDGIMVVTCVFREEAEAIVKDEQLAPYVHLYGVTAALSDMDMPYVAYAVALRAAPRDGEPIVWTREQYRGYQQGTVHHPIENMFPDEA